jgi:hypothetical protein
MAAPMKNDPNATASPITKTSALKTSPFAMSMG